MSKPGFRAGRSLLLLLIGVWLGTSTRPARAQEIDVIPSEHLRSAGDRLEEIVVTARRREEQMQSVPQSVFVLTGHDLESHTATNLRDLQGLVPNLTLAPQQNVGEAAANIFIRGIGQEDFIAGAEQGVSVYVDGVYLSSTRGAMLNLLDVERVEVLRGPQGTLFGKNSVGGALQIITVAPQPLDSEHVSATLGSFNRVELRGIVNRSLSTKVQARLSLGWINRDGYMHRRAPIYIPPAGPRPDTRDEGSERTFVGRLQVQWQGGDRLTAHLAADYARQRNTQAPKRIEAVDPTAAIYPVVNSLIATGALPGPRLDSSILPTDFQETLASGKNYSNLDNLGLAATFARDVGFGMAKLILAYRDLRTRLASDDDGLYFDIASTEFIDRQRQLSAEWQLNGKLRGVEFTVGTFSLIERTRSLPAAGIRSGEVLYTCGCFYTPLNRPAQFSANRKLRSQSHAIYGEAVFDLNSRIGATLGGRYTYERKSLLGQQIAIDLDTLLPTGIVGATGSQRGTWDAFTYRAGLEFRARRDLLVYGSVSKGFKSGGFNVRLVPMLPNLGLTAFAPETALTYELGLKSEWFDHRLRLNASVFQSEYRDIQLRQQTIIGGILTSLVQNAAAARIRGVEVEVDAKPTERLDLRLAYGHLDPKYLDVGRVPGITLKSAFQRTPRNSVGAFVSYEVPFATGIVRLNADFRYRSKEQFQIVASPYDQQAYGLAGARISYQDPRRGSSIALFATNLTNIKYRTAGRGLVSIVGPPRQVGIEFQAGF